MKKVFLVFICIYSSVFCFLNENYWKPDNDNSFIKADKDIGTMVDTTQRQNLAVKLDTITNKNIK